MAGESRRSATRQRNVDAVVEVLRVTGPVSQAELARRSGLSPATINVIVADLRGEGTVEVTPVNGREKLVSLVSGGGLVMSLEVSHDAVSGWLVDLEHEERLDLERAPAEDLRAVLSCAKSLLDRAQVPASRLSGVAIAMDAPVDGRTGAVAAWVTTRLPRWRDVPIAATASRFLGVPVVVENDAQFAALAEWTWGVGRGQQDFFYVRSTMGVGGGFVSGGRIHHGSLGMAGLVGHLVLEPDGPVCYCGSRGCLTTLVSQRAILAAVGGSQPNRRSLDDVIESATAGDPVCRRVLAEAGSTLGRGISQVVKILAPGLVAVGGELGTAGPLVFDALTNTMEVRSLRTMSPGTRIEPAALHDGPALLGGLAAILAERGQGISDLPAWLI